MLLQRAQFATTSNVAVSDAADAAANAASMARAQRTRTLMKFAALFLIVKHTFVIVDLLSSS